MLRHRSHTIEAALRGWLRILRYGQPRPILKKVGGAADAVIFTDGSTWEDGTNPTIGGVSFMWWKETPEAFSAPVPRNLIDSWLPTKNAITLIEIFAAIAAVSHYGPELVGKRLTLLIDSEAALDALIKVYSRVEDVALIVTAFWELVASHQVNVYLDRVPTDSNISDGMSRSRLDELTELSWRQVYPDLQSVVGCNAEIRKNLGFVRSTPGTSWTLFRQAGQRQTADKEPAADAGPTGSPSKTPRLDAWGRQGPRVSTGIVARDRRPIGAPAAAKKAARCVRDRPVNL